MRVCVGVGVGVCVCGCVCVWVWVCGCVCIYTVCIGDAGVCVLCGKHTQNPLLLCAQTVTSTQAHLLDGHWNSTISAHLQASLQ